MTDYLLNANFLIQAKNLHYGFDFYPAFWDWLVVWSEASEVAGIEKGGDELCVRQDALADRVAERPEDFFLRPDGTVIPAPGTVSTWASGSGYQSAAVVAFLQVVDYWLVTYALIHDCTVVTHEVPVDIIYKVFLLDISFVRRFCFCSRRGRSSVRLFQD